MGAEQMRELIESLENFRTRSEAIRRLVARGEEAVEPLIEALRESSQEGARWSILRCLGELGAEEAVPHIAPLLEDRRYRSPAHDALVKIVGEDLGPAAQSWLRWAQHGGRGRAGTPFRRPEMHMTGLPDERLIELALDGCDAEWSAEGQRRYGIGLRPEGCEEAQELTVDLGRSDHEGSEIVIVYTECGAARQEHYEYALRRNMRMPYGALAVHGRGGQARFVMFNTLLREDMSPLELRKSVVAIAERAARARADIEEETDADPGEDQD